MTEISRQNRTEIKIKIAAIGSAGSNALDRILLDGAPKAETLAINTDAQALGASVAAHKLQLGRQTTRGLGTGGDPEIGLAAAEEAAAEIRQALSGATLVLLCAGLGGGTGSGAAPAVARLARESGSLVVAFATMPFGFEGKRRAQQAQEALGQLQEAADIVLCFENDKMGEMVSPKAAIQNAFEAADQTISQSVRSLCDLFQRQGLLRIGFDDLAAALRNQNTRCLFGYGEGDSDNRAHEALARALKNPLMDRGRLLQETSSVLVSIVGGPSMTLNEVQIVMEELNKHIGSQALVHFGTAVEPKMGQRMSVMLLSSLGQKAAKAAVAPAPKPATPAPAPKAVESAAPEPAPEPAATTDAPKEKPAPVRKPGYVEAIQDDFLDLTAAPAASAASTPAPVSVVENEPAKPAAKPAPKPKEERQESLPFDKPSKGRFDKSEPTIIDGEDLDLPTFMRRKVKLQ